METSLTAAVWVTTAPQFLLLSLLIPGPGQGIMHPISANWLLTWHCYRNSRRRPLPRERVKIHLTGLWKPLPDPQHRAGLSAQRQHFLRLKACTSVEGPEHSCAARLGPKHLWPGGRLPMLLTLSFHQRSAECPLTPSRLQLLLDMRHCPLISGVCSVSWWSC